MKARVQTTSILPPKPVSALTPACRLQRKAVRDTRESEAPPIVYEVLQSPGHPLDTTSRDFLQPRLGHDFSQVRIHTDQRAAESAAAVGALAYAVGSHIVFGAGAFAPQSVSGRELLAHELVHVVQQTGGATCVVPDRLAMANQGEREADSVAQSLVAGEAAPPQIGSAVPTAVARKQAPADGKQYEQRLARVEDLLSYGLFDWAITDAEATEAFQFLQAMSPEERARAFKKIRLDRLISNLPAQYQADLAKMVSESGGEQTVQAQVEKILTYTFFDWIGSVSQAEAQQALGLLEALADDQRDRVLDRIPPNHRRRLHDALPAAGQARFLQMWQQKQEREFNRQAEAIRKLERGEKLLLRVLLKETKEQLEAFSPQGVGATISEEGTVYYAPLEESVSIAGLTRAEAEAKLATALSAKAGVSLLVELKPQPPGFVEEYVVEAPAPAQAVTPSAPPKATPAPDPLAERRQEFRELIIYEGHALHDLYEKLQKLPSGDPARTKLEQELDQNQDAFDHLYKWFEENENSPTLLKFSPPELLGRFRAQATMRAVKQSVSRQLQEEKEAKAYSPEVQQARLAKQDEFLNLAVALRGDFGRKLPYTIPVPSEGVDILVTGDPARQAVLSQIADELMGWSREHFLDNNYTSVNAKSILLYVLNSGYGAALRATATEPLESEVIDRGEIVPEKLAAAFGKTVVIGLTAIGAIGAAVGLGIISGGVALIILGALAVYAGVTSYLERRKEIEEKNYKVPIPVTAVHAAGDALGVSQLIEGITGERLGINERLTSAQRSEQAGAGAGSVALLLLGSRVFRVGQGLGQGLRLSGPGYLPETLEGVPREKLGEEFGKTPAPRKPAQNPNPGPVEARARAALPERLRVGFDAWMEQMRSNPKRAVDVEEVLRKMSQDRIEQISKKPADDYYAHVAEAERVAEAKGRSASDPLRPRLKNTEWKDGVTIHYEKTPPEPGEIAQAREIQARTGEPVHLFGDTPSGKTYPGIDGTIGEPPRPLQLKELGGNDPAYLKVHAADAFESAAKHGYSKVEVHLRVKGSTIAEIKAAWQGRPAAPRGAEIGWETRLRLARSKLTLARLVIEGSDGVWVVEAPPTSPNLPGVKLPSSGGKPDEDKAATGK
jgi:hypothetical protein